MDQFTRRLVGIGVQGGAVTGVDVCRMFNAAAHGQAVPRHLSTDHDPLFEAHRWRANLRILEIDEIKTVPLVPLSHPFVERLIGTMRREFAISNESLASFRPYYNVARCHAALGSHAHDVPGWTHAISRPSERGALGFPLPGSRAATGRGLTSNSRCTGTLRTPDRDPYRGVAVCWSVNHRAEYATDIG